MEFKEITPEEIILIPQNKKGWSAGDLINGQLLDAYCIAKTSHDYSCPLRYENIAYHMYLIDKSDKGMLPGDLVYCSAGVVGNFSSFEDTEECFQIIASTDPVRSAYGILGISADFIKGWVALQGSKFAFKVQAEMELDKECNDCHNFGDPWGDEFYHPKIKDGNIALSIVQETNKEPMSAFLEAITDAAQSVAKAERLVDEAFVSWLSEAAKGKAIFNPIFILQAAKEWHSSRMKVAKLFSDDIVENVAPISSGTLDIEQIAIENKVKLTLVKEGDEYHVANGDDICRNSSSCCDVPECPEITIGMYDDPELRDISFLHELAHIVFEYPDWRSGRASKYEWEMQVWCNAYKLAEKHRHYVSPKAVKWAHDQLATYIGWEEREVKDYKRYVSTTPDWVFLPYTDFEEAKRQGIAVKLPGAVKSIYCSNYANYDDWAKAVEQSKDSHVV